MRAECALVIAIVGAESSGKTTLARALREFCDRERRTPRQDEQAALAAEQSRRIADATRGHAVVVADTTALMTAIYSEQVFGDRGLYAGAEAAHRRCDLTLVTALDLPWQADGLQRDGAHVRAPVDALLRAALQRMDLPFAVVSGRGAARLDSAWRAVRGIVSDRTPLAEYDERPSERVGPCLGRPGAAALAPASDQPSAGPSPQRWHCERWGDADCERRLFAPLLAPRA